MMALHILIVEDEKMLQDVVVGLLDRLVTAFPGAVITRVARMDEAKKIIDGLPPDVTLLDLNLEDMVAAQTVKEINELSKRSPIIVLTGMDNPKLRRDAIERGASAYILKLDMLRQPGLLERAIIACMSAFRVTKRERLSDEIDALRSFALANSHATPET